MTELRVTELWRYPVKSLLGERVDRVDISTNGLIGDRAWSLVDTATGLHLTARREPELLMAQARLRGQTVDDGVAITLPDGSEAVDDGSLSAWLGRDVQLVMASSGRAGTYETALDEAEVGDWVQWTGPEGSFHDSTRTMVSLVSTTTLGHWDRRRFRINVILDGSGEDDLVGSTISLGGATLNVAKQIDRCVMTTRPQAALGDEPELARDLNVLTTINRDRANMLGIGALVSGAGTVGVGDEVDELSAR